MTLQEHYQRMRRKGWRADQAMHSARTFALADLIGEDYVRIRIMEDDDWFSWQDGDSDQSEIRRANDEGVWGIVGEWFNQATGQWQHADSVWGFIGDDWQDSGYDSDVLQSAIDEYISATRPLAAMLTSEGVGL